MSMDAMIEVQNLRKTFGSFVAVSDISFKLNRGEVLGFLGPNGAGKSTAMKMITGFLTPSGGQVSVNGHDVTVEPLKVKSAIGYLPEGAPASKVPRTAQARRWRPRSPWHLSRRYDEKGDHTSAETAASVAASVSNSA